MTTEAADGYAVFNPHNKLLSELPVIYGLNNGGTPGFYLAVLVAEDGKFLGSHLCSSEGYMRMDLGILSGTGLDRHKGFQEHYPDGYRMDFVPYDQITTHPGLQVAIKLNQEQPDQEG